MDVEDAWNKFLKSSDGSISKSSVVDRLDVLASQLNDLQTDVSRLAENIPDMQGDAAAMDAAGGGDAPVGGMPPMMGGMGPDMLGGGAPPTEGEDMEMMEEMGGGGDELLEGGALFSDDEIAQILNEMDGEVPGGEGLGGGGSLVDILKELIAGEDDPAKLAALAEALALATESAGDVGMDDVPDEIMEEGEPILKSADPGKEAENAVKTDLDDGPKTEGSFEDSDPIDKSEENVNADLPQKLAVEIAEVVEGILAEALLGEDSEDTSDEACDDGSEPCDTPKKESPKEEDDDEGEDKDEDEDEDKDDTKPFTASEQDMGTFEKSFRDRMLDALSHKHGVDGMVAKSARSEEEVYESHLAHMTQRPDYPFMKSDFEDGGGKRITPLERLEMVRKSDRPPVHTTVNGELTRPDLRQMQKSGSGNKSFKEIMGSKNIHDAMQDRWNEYNIFKSGY